MTIDFSTLLLTLFQVWGLLLLLPAAFMTALTLLNRQTKSRLAAAFGINSQVYLGFMGIFIHELSHWLAAVLAGHHITSARFLKLPHPDRHIPTGEPDLSMGYVNHTWNQRNGYQVMGNLLIGVAPIFGCSAVLLVITWGLAPIFFQAMVTVGQQFSGSSLRQLWPALLAGPHPIARWTLLTYLALNISVGGFDLSTADLNNARLGLGRFVLLISVLTILATLLGGAPILVQGLLMLMTLTGFILSYSLVISLLASLIVRALTRFS